MGYLIGEIIVCLLIAFVLGLIIGWLLKRMGCAREVAELEAALAALRADGASGRASPGSANAPDASAAMLAAAPAAAPVAVAAATGNENSASSYEVEEIEGIGPGYGKRLRGMSIDSTESLLQRCVDADGVAAVAEQVGIEQFVVSKWACMADLLRVAGVGGQDAELLAWAGVESVQDLAGRKPETLARALASTNAQESRTAAAPDTAAVASWVEAASKLSKILP